MASEVLQMPFRFLDLPAELRAAIYEVLLTERSPIHLILQDKAYKKRMIRRGSKREPKKLTLDIGTGKFELRPTPLDKTSVLCTSKQLHTEGIEILYGRNDFEFPSLTVLKEWLGTIGSHGNGNIQRLWIDQYTKAAAKAVSELLINANRLKGIHIKHHNFCSALPKVDAVRLVKDFRSVIKSLAIEDPDSKVQKTRPEEVFEHGIESICHAGSMKNVLECVVKVNDSHVKAIQEYFASQKEKESKVREAKNVGKKKRTRADARTVC